MSKIEVNTIDTQCGANLTVGAACKSVTIAGNDIRSNNYKASDGGIIISQSGTNITLGASGDTISLASGATQTGFGRTGTVDWCTTAKTAPFTGVSGKGYFVNTTCAAVTVTLPATPSAGDIISIKDYGGTWQTNNLTLCNNGSKINGACAQSILNTKSQSVTLIYVDSTKGWQDIQDSTAGISGGFIYNVEYLVVAGGGGGAGSPCFSGGGGGAGGFRTAACFPVSSLSGPYTVTVGAGANGTGPGATSITKGNDSVFSSITSSGGGSGVGVGITGPVCNHNGGSGGGTGGDAGLPTGNTGGSGNTPPVSPPQGNPGGDGYVANGNVNAGGGGGASGAGGGYPIPANTGGNGGIGSPTAIFGSIPQAPTYGTPGPNPGRYFAGGGGGSGGYGGAAGTPGSGGAGGGGGGCGVAGTVNTGGGGGGYRTSTAGNGGPGIVALKYTTACASPTVSGGTAYTCGSYTIRVFTSDGTFTP